MIINKLIRQATTTVAHERDWDMTTSFFNEHVFAGLVASKVLEILDKEGLLKPGSYAEAAKALQQLYQE